MFRGVPLIYTYVNESDLKPELEQRERQEEVRSALIAFHKRLLKQSDNIGIPYKWHEFIEPLQSILRKYKDILPAETWQRLQGACKLTDETRSGIKTAADILSLELEKAVKTLYVRTRRTKSVIAGVIIAAVIVGPIAYLNLASYQMVIRNNGCDPIQIPIAVPVWTLIFGLDLPKQPIPTDGNAIAKVPPLTINVDATGKETIKFNILGVDYYLERAGNVDSVQLDGEEVLDQSKSMNLRSSLNPLEQQSHELVIRCG